MIIEFLKSRYKAYKTRVALENLSDRQLDDIGLTRMEIHKLSEMVVRQNAAKLRSDYFHSLFAKKA